MADVMFILGLVFFITLMRGIRFMTLQYVPCGIAGKLGNDVRNVIKLYSCKGFTCQTTLTDGELKKIKDKLKNEYVGEIEWKIHHMKEQCQCIKADMNFSILPNRH